MKILIALLLLLTVSCTSEVAQKLIDCETDKRCQSIFMVYANVPWDTFGYTTQLVIIKTDENGIVQRDSYEFDDDDMIDVLESDLRKDCVREILKNYNQSKTNG
jgi:hypothetical protein